jgi:hypothetical protein
MMTVVSEPDKPLVYVNPAFEQIGYAAGEWRNPRLLGADLDSVW